MEEHLVRNKCEEELSLYEKKEISCCEYLYTPIKYHEERSLSTIKILLFSICNTLLVYFSSFLIYAIDEQKIDHMRTNFDFTYVIFYFILYFLIEIKFLPYRLTCFDSMIPGFCCCKIKYFNGEMCCNAKACKYFYYVAWFLFLCSYGGLVLYWAIWDSKNLAAYVVGDVFISLSYMLGFKLLKSLSHLKFMLMMLITSLICYAFFIFDYILIYGYDFSFQTLRRLFLGGSIFIEGDIINEFEPYNFRVIFPFYTLVKGFMIYFYFYVFYEYYKGKNNYASSLLMILIPAYALSLFVKLLILAIILLIVFASSLKSGRDKYYPNPVVGSTTYVDDSTGERKVVSGGPGGVVHV